MRDEDTGVVPLVENGRPVGLITDRDIVVRAVADGTSFEPPGARAGDGRPGHRASPK